MKPTRKRHVGLPGVQAAAKENIARAERALEIMNMVTSEDTVSQVYRVIRKYLTKDRITRLLDDLEKIPGNQSFRATIEALTVEHERSK